MDEVERCFILGIFCWERCAVFTLFFSEKRGELLEKNLWEQKVLMDFLVECEWRGSLIE